MPGTWQTKKTINLGNPSSFGLECGLSEAFEQLGFKALGYFLIHLGGMQYGVCQPDATMLACSVDAIGEIKKRRGTHAAPFSTAASASDIADALIQSTYAQNPDTGMAFGFSLSEFKEAIHEANLHWAPDGDQAFDDGSHLLQFDVADKVRLIGFKTLENYRHDPRTLRDIWLDADLFYAILAEFLDSFSRKREELLAAKRQGNS
ncbi:MAG TPA: Imm42 family immunity protein [Candidatus Limnocylindria bacterium]|jgi:hypothetical protein|nr:Imm42 family immunity protein [Candidatus Limnocylindria bacterium]